MIAVGDRLYSADGREHFVSEVLTVAGVPQYRLRYPSGLDNFEYATEDLRHSLRRDQLYTREQYDRLLLARGLRKALERFARDASDQKIITACTAAGIGPEKERVGE